MHKPPRTIEIDPVEQEINKFVDQYANENLSDQQAQAHLSHIGNMAQVRRASNGAALVRPLEAPLDGYRGISATGKC